MVFVERVIFLQQFSIEEKIISDGFLQNEKLKRKWIIGQLQKYYIIPNDPNLFDEHFFKNKPYHYMWTVLLREIKMMSKIEKSRNLTKTEKQKIIKQKEIFINKNLILAMLNDFDHQSKQTESSFIEKTKNNIENSRSYSEIEKQVEIFIKKINPKKYHYFKKPEIWKNAFKRIGLYHTFEEIIKYQNYRFSENDTINESLNTLSTLLQETDLTGINKLLPQITKLLGSE